MVATDGRRIMPTEIKRFLKECLPAANRNDDGWGAFWERPGSKGFVKSPDKFTEADIDKILKRYRGSRFFAFHLRLATSDVNYKNTHPFTMETFRGVHNGVVQVPDFKLGVDSLELLTKIESTDGETLGKSIEKAMGNGVSGTYSVLLHSFKEECLYYFRNSPSFGLMLVKDDKLIYGATNIDRLNALAKPLFGIFPDAIKTEPTKDNIYKIDLHNGNFTRIGKITSSYRVVYGSNKCSKNRTSSKTITDYSKLAPRRGWKGYDSDSYGGV
jgi:hypothetical protein